MGTRLHAVQHEATSVNAMVTGATLGTIHVVLEFTVDFAINDLGIATSSTHDTDTVSSINGNEVSTTVDFGGTSKHDGSLSHLVGDEVVDLSARVHHVLGNSSIT